MDRGDLDVARLAAAYMFTTGGPHAASTRSLAFEKAQELYRALEDGPVRAASELLDAFDGPGLDDRLAQRATGNVNDHGLSQAPELDDTYRLALFEDPPGAF